MPQPDDHSFRKLLHGFVISAGTQVVLTPFLRREPLLLSLVLSAVSG
jgi:hypothetical protein